MLSHTITIAPQPLNVHKKKVEYYLFGSFLDDFYYEKHNRYALIKDKPPMNDESYAFVCKLAATAHKLANDYELPVPEWLFKDIYIYNGEYYGRNIEADAPEYIKKHLKETSPDEFKTRYIFLGDSVLSRA